MSTYGFIGLGLIGGSIAKKLRIMDPEAKIYVSTRSEKAKQAARDEGVMDGEFTPGGSDVPLDIIFLCAPVEANLSLLKELSAWVPATTTITDVGSVKSPILTLAKELKLPNFVGGHPMMGTEFSGYAASTERLLKNAVYLVLPTMVTEQTHTDRLSAFIASLEAIPVVVPGDRHDMAVAAISHLPHVVSAALTNTAAETDQQMFADTPTGLRRLSAGGFKDITRISSSSPSLWAEISLENKENVLKMLEHYQKVVDHYKTCLENEDFEGLTAFFASAKTYRDSIIEQNRT